MIIQEPERARQNREEIIQELSGIIDSLHKKMSWSTMERKVGVSTQTLQSMWRGETPSLRTAIMILHAVGYCMKIEKD